MIIHFSILLLILVVSAFYEHQFCANKLRAIANGGVSSDYVGSIIPWLIVFGYITFLAGMRTSVNDTVAYRTSFEALNASWAGIGETISGGGKDIGFSVLMHLFKMYVSTDYHMWFLFFAAVESIILIFFLRRESVSFFYSCYFLFVSTLYYNYFSMMRQWMAVVIVFFASKYIKKGKFIPYLLFCILAAQIHNSAYFMILVYFFVKGAAWTKKQLFFISAFAAGMILLQPLMSFVDSSFGDTTYNYVVNTMQTSSGSSWIRIPIALVPVAFSYSYRENFNPNDKMISICVNMSLLNLMLTVLATFTSGLFIGRMSNYTTVYLLILFPYLLINVVEEKNRTIIKILFVIIYFLFYYYQMIHQGAFPYGSDVLGYFS